MRTDAMAVMALDVVSDLTVSVITPCYNGSRYLEETLRSAVGQSRPPLEVIVVDDGSSDESAAIAERFGPPVRVVRQANQGESVARNRGLAEARGTHVLFLDADDLLAPEALARLTEAVRDQPDAVALMGCAWFTTGPASPHTVRHLRHEGFYPDIIESNFGPPNCWLTPRAVVQAAGGFCEAMRWFEDWDLWWRVGLHAGGLVCVPYVGAIYRQHSASQLATTNMTDRTRGHAALMSRMVAALLERPEYVQRYGDRLFWSAWTAFVRARENGVPRKELAQLARGLRGITVRRPPSLRRSGMARAVRWLGVRGAVALQPR
jgi:glycosyltransferase involved in cell wall biosynthesis